MAAYLRLQGLTTASGGSDTAQSLDNAVDVGRYGRLVVTVQRAAAGDPGAVLVLQTAATKDSSAFVDLAPAIDLSRTGVVEVELTGISRWVRWKAYLAGLSTDAKFIIDLVAREQ